jgi:hypothetical protein
MHLNGSTGQHAEPKGTGMEDDTLREGEDVGASSTHHLLGRLEAVDASATFDQSGASCEADDIALAETANHMAIADNEDDEYVAEDVDIAEKANEDVAYGIVNDRSEREAAEADEMSDVDTTLHAAFHRIQQAPGYGPVRKHHPLSASAIKKTASQLFAGCDPTTPHGWKALLQRELPHIYVPSVLDESRLRWLFADTVTNGRRMFVHGTAPGVGAKTLAADWARAFNNHAFAHKDPRRVAFIMLDGGASTTQRLLDDLSTALQVRLSYTELRRGSGLIINRILGAAARQNVCAIIIAQPSKAHAAAREIISSLLYKTDPNYHVPLEPHPLHEHARKVGVILVDPVAPELVFRASPNVLLQLRGRVAELRPLQSYAEIAEAMRRADIGLRDLDLSYNEDLSMVKTIVAQTGGLLAQMHPLFELIDLIATASGHARPTPEMVDAALPLFRKMVDLTAIKTTTPSGHMFVLQPRPIVGARTSAGAPGHGGASDPDTTLSDNGRAKALKKKGDAKERAVAEACATRRKRNVNVFESDQ